MSGTVALGHDTVAHAPPLSIDLSTYSPTCLVSEDSEVIQPSPYIRLSNDTHNRDKGYNDKGITQNSSMKHWSRFRRASGMSPRAPGFAIDRAASLLLEPESQSEASNLELSVRNKHAKI